MYVSVGTNTSSPALIPAACSARLQRSGAGVDAGDADAAADERSQFLLERLGFRAGAEKTARKHSRDCVKFACADHGFRQTHHDAPPSFAAMTRT